MDDNELIINGKRVLSKVMKTLRNRSSRVTEPESGYFMIPSDNGKYEQALFWIPTQGCSYVQSATGGCTMCNFGGSSVRLSDDSLLEQFIDIIENPPVKNSPILNYGGQGSFFDEVEHSNWLRENILQEVAKRDSIEAFVCESRPEYATKKKIKQMREILGNKIIEVGIGVESTNPLVREGIINKNFDEYAYRNFLDYAREYQLEVSLNVMFKPNLLTESEAIDDSVKTINDLLKGVSADDPIKRIILMMINIKPDTLIEWSYKKGIYDSPLLWSCVEVLDRLTERERRFVKVLGFDTGINPLDYASNKDGTTTEVRKALKDFSRNHEIESLLELRKKYADAPSYKAWKKIMNQESYEGLKPLKERLFDFYGSLEREFNLKPYTF